MNKLKYQAIIITVFIILAVPAYNFSDKKIREYLPSNYKIDSCTQNGDMETYDTNTLYEKINGYATFFLERGFVKCVYRNYRSNDPLIADKDIQVTLNEMICPDSAESVLKGTMQYKDTAEVLDSLNDIAIIIQGSWNLSCFMQKGKYFIEIGAISYDTTSGLQESIKQTFKNFCIYFDKVLQ